MTDTAALAPGDIAADVTFAAGVYDVPGLLTVTAGTTITPDAEGVGGELLIQPSNQAVTSSALVRSSISKSAYNSSPC